MFSDRIIVTGVQNIVQLPLRQRVTSLDVSRVVTVLARDGCGSTVANVPVALRILV